MTDKPTEEEKENALLKKRVEKLEGEIASTKGRAQAKARKAGQQLVDGKVSYELTNHEKEIKLGYPWGSHEDTFVFNPAPKQRVPKGGAWVMIVRQLPGIERGIDRHIRVCRFFWVEHQSNADSFGFMPDGNYKVICRSPWGDVHLWPYEYSVMQPQELLDLWQTGDLKFHPTNVQLARFNDIVFYARQRGIGLADAMVLALGTIKGPVGWFEPATERLRKDAEAMERRAHRPWKSRRTIEKPMKVLVSVNGKEFNEQAKSGK